MHRFNRVNSAERLFALFAPTTATKRLFRRDALLRPLAFIHSSSPRCLNDNGRKVLPPELSRNAAKLTCESTANGGVCDVYLVGTVHVSTESSKEVQAVINYLKPQVVLLELCSSRVGVLYLNNFKVPTIGQMVELWWKKNRNPFGMLCGRLVAEIASQLEVLPGAEFRVAYEEANKYGGKVILGDRPVQITMQRTWAKMPLWHKTKLLSLFIFQAVHWQIPEHLREKLARSALWAFVKLNIDLDAIGITLLTAEMSKHFPTLIETLVHERDQYMSAVLLRIAREHSSVVAVVGKGHLAGIQKNWKQPVEVNKLLEIPPKRNTIPLRTIVATVAGFAIIYRFIK